MRESYGIPSAVYSPVCDIELLLHTSHTSGFTPSENMGNPNSPWLQWSTLGKAVVAELPNCSSSSKAPLQPGPSLMLSGAAGCSESEEM